MERSIDIGKGMMCQVRKSKRARRMRITIGADKRLVLTLPTFVSFARGRVFLAAKTGWIHEKLQALAARPVSLLHRGSVEEYRENRMAARKLVESRLAYFQDFYGVTWKRVSIRNQRTRWGSCSRAGDLSFNYRLLFLPAYLADYVIVHELCHLREFSHSPRFWALVGLTFPDSLVVRRELRLF